jgi:peroxiredoxin Q/BCP
MGKIYQGIFRATFLIDPTGTIAMVWPKVKPDEHAAEVLAFLKENLP